MADEIKFKAGDVVQLKSGGPEMTVEFIDNEMREVHCKWFHKLKNQVYKVDEADFAPEAIKLIHN